VLFIFETLRLPLIGIFDLVQVSVDQAFSGVEEHPSVVTEAKAVRDESGVTRGLLLRRTA
jgi:hypothetical protein